MGNFSLKVFKYNRRSKFKPLTATVVFHKFKTLLWYSGYMKMGVAVFLFITANVKNNLTDWSWF